MAFAVGGLLGLMLCALAVLLEGPAPAVAQGPAACNTFDSPGAHAFEVPDGVTEIEATVFGAQGGDVVGTGSELGDGGLGGGATGVVIPVTPGELLEIGIGAAGGNSQGPSSPAPVGGFGGGGDGAVGIAHTSATGGGASQINRGATPLVIVGGGGGGAHGGDGGAGGEDGEDGTKFPATLRDATPGLGGQADGTGGAGGVGDPSPEHDGSGGTLAAGGEPGQGGDGGGDPDDLPIDGGGGGGGGYHGGGGGGGGGTPGNSATGGGGGSSFDATGTATFETGVQSGHGLVTLTYDCDPPPTPPAPCVTFDTAGTYDFEVPAGLTEVEATVFGAEGGDRPATPPFFPGGEGGLGGGAMGLTIPVTPGETLTIEVGGTGADAPAGTTGGSPGGGGDGGPGSAGGGGSSEILRGTDSLVIGGGGGGASAGADGGDGGFIGENGEAGAARPGLAGGFSGGNGGLGGGAGVAAGGDGSPDQGGAGGTGAGGIGGAGGGGGAVGGGGASGSDVANRGASGGGGSSAHTLGLVPVTWHTGVEEGDGRVALAFDCADVAVTKAATLVDRNTIEYSVTVENSGFEDATGVIARDPLPVEVEFLSDDCGGVLDASGWSWNIGDLAQGASVTCVITVEATDRGRIANTARVTANETEFNEQNNRDRAVVRVRARPRLVITKGSSVDRARPGGVVTFRLVVRNRGVVAAHNARVCDVLPAGLRALRARGADRRSAERFCWRIERLRAGAKRTMRITVQVKPNASGTQRNQAVANAPGARRKSDVRAIRVVGAPAGSCRVVRGVASRC